ncbi:MAG: FeoA family protein [Pyrinomonadaceae bacterium]
MENHPSNNRTLAQLPIGEEAKVLSIDENGAVSKRLMEMGVVPGVAVRVVKTAPFGDPIEIRIRNYSLALRRSEAQHIKVSK